MGEEEEERKKNQKFFLGTLYDGYQGPPGEGGGEGRATLPKHRLKTGSTDSQRSRLGPVIPVIWCTWRSRNQ